MRQCYNVHGTRAIADLDYDGGRWVITRINVPATQREHGFASFLLAEICLDADREGAELYLQVQPGGGRHGRTADQLTAWYSRYGFRALRDAGWMVRRPAGAEAGCAVIA